MVEELTMDDLKYVKDCNMMEKAVIKLIFTSGMSAANVIKLNYGDFLVSYRGFDRYVSKPSTSEFDKCYDHIGVWCLERVKTGNKYITLSSSETKKSLINYLLDRCRNEGFISAEEPLFVNENGNRITQVDISKIFKKLSNKIGKKVRAHDLRKLFVKTLKDNGTDTIFLDMVLGHKINPVIAAHFKYDIGYLKETYREFEEYLILESSDKQHNQDSSLQILKGLFFKRDSYE